MSNRVSIKALSHEELSNSLLELGFKKFRIVQVEQWLWAKNVESFAEMTNLSKADRAELEELFFIEHLSLVERQVSADGTRKYLFALGDGTTIESVGIPSRDYTHLTVCFSTQAGCAMNCSFCATGRGGFTRNLNIGEMLDQITFIGQDFGLRVSNVVAMGQGEPFLNYDAVLSALRIINDSKIGLGIGARHITVSTCGIIKGIERFSNETEQFTLAVSLHSAIQKTRDELMPGVVTQTIPELVEVLQRYSNKTKRRPTFEYALIDSINDTDEHLDALIDLCSDMLIHVNLIPLNPISDVQKARGMLEPSRRLSYFERELKAAGIETSIRSSRGGDIDGACGQLRQKHLHL